MVPRKIFGIMVVLLFSLLFGMRTAPPALAAAPSNDDFTSPVVISNVPFSDSVDLGAASVEVDEPSQSCTNPGDMTNSVWYAFTPTTSNLLTANLSAYQSVLALYTVSSLNDLTPVDCRHYWQGTTLSFTATAGTTYYFQVGSLYGYGGSATFSLDVAGPPIAEIYYSYPDVPSPFDMIQFYGNSYDPAGVGITSQDWDFGDGATATGSYPTHRYATDGVYVVTLTVTTADGRQGSATRTVRVETHDVSITKFTTPQSGRTGQTSKIVVGINNRLYPETVTVYLYRSTRSGFQQIGMLTQYVPKSNNKSTTDFLFSYTLTPEDAAIGKVTFKVSVSLEGVYDSLPGDNEAISFPTKVSGGNVSAAGLEAEAEMQEEFLLRSQMDENAEMGNLFLLPDSWLYLPSINGMK
jgi:PKD repeat protein